ncbi:hypothetical protein MMU07_10225 [Aquiflexum sp. LQ15W]|uniref:hypothetical protein n=1 Tax=Cognataquiflexum nitidum TaxID=2922272 RepID=UPI001F147876|nr:hypothetical protein [Cognataquiflexum nitidum]MCH6199960.1 hypothetical protein [Cognataquiflexum nitidum]
MEIKCASKIVCSILVILIFTNSILAQEIDIRRKTNFGNTEIYLPPIEGYRECYLEPTVKQIADGTEVPSNMVLGFYLNNRTFEKIGSSELSRFDDYFKIYGTIQVKDYKANRDILKQMQDAMGGNFMAKNWDLMKKEVDKIGLEVEIGVPIVIKNYNLNKNSFTYVMIARYELEGVDPFTLVMAINGLLINEKLIWMAYYLHYDGEESISRLQRNNDFILEELISGNLQR